ncbi:MAG: hypothetical protein Crog4KO_19340 [Crocinitomicaceae bacterium]
MDDEEMGYCTDSVLINGQKYDNGKIAAGAYEIQFDSLGFQVGDSIHLVIYHHSNCKPKILIDHGVIRRGPVFEVAQIDSEKIRWSLNRAIIGRFRIEVYRWNKWVKLGDIESFATKTDYEFPLQDSLHTGVNKIRVTFLNPSDNYRQTSKAVVYNFYRKPIQLNYNKKAKTITFPQETRFELYNAHGDIIQRGYGNSIDLSNQDRGVYYVNFDNENQKVRVR